MANLAEIRETQTRQILEALRTCRLAIYRPYSKQLEFHAAGREHAERGLLAANQVGKTLCAGMEVAMHLTGFYPDWWEGRRFEGPTRWWVANTNNETTRDNPQRILLGEVGEWGTGTIPKSCLDLPPLMSRGFSGLVDRIRVKHVSGGWSLLKTKAYDQERKKWQGETLHGIWFDEEPPMDVYSEGLTRLNVHRGLSLLTATPLMGMTEVVGFFYPRPTTMQRHLVQMTIDDAEHYSKEQREEIIGKYMPHEREARTKGIPMLGSGRVFPIPEESIRVTPFAIPDHWAQLGGMDFGWDHPFAAARIAHDRDSDTVYVTQTYRERETTPVIHAAALRPWGAWLPWAWPHDGHQHDKQAGLPIAESYRQQGLKMLPMHATFQQGGYSLEAGVLEMLTRMQTGRLKVFDHLEEWFQEFRLYHRKDGKIVKQQDDLLSATRQAVMMLRAARGPQRTVIPPVVGSDYDPLGHASRMH